MLLTIIAAAAVVSSEGPSCAILSRHQLLTGTSIDCCESCSLGWIRSTSWITSSVKTEMVDSDSQQIRFEHVGSGGETTDLETLTSNRMSATDSKEVTRPCGECVSVDDCLNHGGHVNMWHRTCTQL